MSKTTRRVCDVTGVKTNNSNFHPKQSHVKAVDNFRRSTGASKNQLVKMFNQLRDY